MAKFKDDVRFQVIVELDFSCKFLKEKRQFMSSLNQIYELYEKEQTLDKESTIVKKYLNKIMKILDNFKQQVI